MQPEGSAGLMTAEELERVYIPGKSTELVRGRLVVLEHRIAEQPLELGNMGENVTDLLLENFGRDQERFLDLGGYEYHARVDGFTTTLRRNDFVALVGPNGGYHKVVTNPA